MDYLVKILYNQVNYHNYHKYIYNMYDLLYLHYLKIFDYLNHQFDTGAVIIITTARPSSFELFTKQELEKIGIKYHQLVMNCGRGTRVIFNDKDPENPELDRAIGINFTRDGGFKSVDGPPKIENYESN